MSVDPDGTVFPCQAWTHRKEEQLGTVHDIQLDERRNTFLHLSSSNILGCDTCMAQSVCGGGCRVVAVNAGLDLHSGTHPGHCLTMRAHARAVERIYDTLMAEQNATFMGALRRSRPQDGVFSELLSR